MGWCKKVGMVAATVLSAVVLWLVWVVWDANRYTPIGLEAATALGAADGARFLVLPDGRLLEYFDYGDPSETDLVLLGLHGGATTGKGSEWSINAALGLSLRPRPSPSPSPEPSTSETPLGPRRVIAPTYPGFGLSTPHDQGSGATLGSYGDDVCALLGHLGIKRVIVLGGSLGGAVGISVAHSVARSGHTQLLGVLLGAPGIPAMPDFGGFAQLIPDPANGFIQHRLMPTLLGPVVIKYLYASAFSKPAEEIFATFGELPFAGMEAMAQDMIRSQRYYNRGQPDLMKIITTPAQHYDFPAFVRDLAEVPIHIWQGDNDTMVALGHKHTTLTIVSGASHFWLRHLAEEPLEIMLKQLGLKK
ncbi:hypothetical protein Pelo_12225 [Pelomyxa schiedti]|nr:hypothetical protein Pelo_12225 [Pelomyxa schiedti]